MSAFKSLWTKAYPPLVQHLHLQVRFNVKSKAVELRTSRFTKETGALQKGADFIQALSYGFELEDAIAMLRLDDM
jgi:RNA-binding protein PNO1